MKKSLLLILTLSVCVWAADSWQSKPFTEWSDKEIQKVLNSSPWSKEVSVPAGSGGGGGGRGRRGGGGGDTGDAPMSAGGTGAGGSRGGGGGDMSTPGGNLNSSINVIVSWRTALPCRQAIARQKYGADAATSADAKKMIEEPQKFYAIVVGGLPGRMLRGSSDEMKAGLLKNTMLEVKGKDPIQASDLQTAANGQQGMIVFLFPKTNPIDADDKEVEFVSRIGPMTVKQKFKLKDIMFNGKLEL